jgi:hypothetical protein
MQTVHPRFPCSFLLIVVLFFIFNVLNVMGWFLKPEQAIVPISWSEEDDVQYYSS